jgi:hypothetical protein
MQLRTQLRILCHLQGMHVQHVRLPEIILRPTHGVSGRLGWIVTVLVRAYRPPRLSYRHKRASLNPARLPNLILRPTYDAI